MAEARGFLGAAWVTELPNGEVLEVTPWAYWPEMVALMDIDLPSGRRYVTLAMAERMGLIRRDLMTGVPEFRVPD